MLAGSEPSFTDGEGGWKGLGAGLTRDDIGATAGILSKAPPTPPGEKREGRVPARARRPDWRPSAGVMTGAKSGKPSVGDSGIFSRSGVELPLVGGPSHGFMGMPEMPS